jgi:hypothetical protein
MNERSEHLRTVTNNDGAAILDVDRGVITTLNATGAFVWERLQRNATLDSVVADLAQETGQDPAIVRRDVTEFARQLEESLSASNPHKRSHESRGVRHGDD